MPTPAQWSALAPLWSACEGDGLAPRHFDQLDHFVEGPCLVVGSGLGLLVDALRQRGVQEVVGLDVSPAMAERAASLRGTNTIVGDVARLPFADATFGTVVVASGVLDPGDPSALAAALSSCARVLQPGGHLLAGFFEASDRLAQVAEPLGLLEAGTQRTDRIARLWALSRGSDKRAAAEAVCGWTGADLDAARNALIDAQDFLSSWRGLLDSLAARLVAQGVQDPVERVCTLLSWSVPAYPGDTAVRAGLPTTLRWRHAVQLPDDCLRIPVAQRV